MVVALTKDLEGVRILFERIAEVVRTSPPVFEGGSGELGLCCGVSVGAAAGGLAATKLLEHADFLLRRGKEQGRGRTLVEMLPEF